MTVDDADLLLSKLLQLHEEIEIYYIVDGYVASLCTHDGEVELFVGKGTSPVLALCALAKRIKEIYPLGVTIQQLRKIK